MITGGKEATASDRVLSSFLGGAFSGIPCSMWELTMIQQQRFGGSIVATPARVIKVTFHVSTLNRSFLHKYFFFFFIHFM